MSSNPPCPVAATRGNPFTGGMICPLPVMRRSAPLRSVTRKPPSGRKASPQGWFR